MNIMPSNSSGWFWHSLARETGRLGHLYSPRGQRGPWPWFPYALDNGAFSCWDQKTNTFDHTKWGNMELHWRGLLFWAQAAPTKPLWAIVPDVPGNAAATIQRWTIFAPRVQACGIPLAVAVQDGMTPEQVRQLDPAPEVICIGGTTEWKWATVEDWCANFKRVHVLRCNSPEKLDYLHSLGVESTDGTGWNRGDRRQTQGVEEWCQRHKDTGPKIYHPLWPHACRGERKGKTGKLKQTTFA